MAFANSGKQIFSVLMASTVLMQGNLACFAADSSAAQKKDQSSTAAGAAIRQLLAAAVNPSALMTADNDLDRLAGVRQQATEPTPEESTFSLPESEPPAVPTIAAGPDKSEKTVLSSPLLLAADQPGDGFVLSGAASVSPDQAPDRIDQLTKNILLKEIELERFNLHYTTQVAIQGRWKSWRYNGLQEVNGAMGLTGAIISVAYRGARLEDAKMVKPCIQESANYISEIGAYIGAGAAAMEFGINGYHDLVARHRGYGPGESIRKVAALKTDIERMLAERSALTRIEGTSPALSGQTELDVAEGQVLVDMLDESLREFERFHVGARRMIAFEQMQYLLDFSKYTINGLGFNFAFLSLHRHHRRFNGNAGTLFMVSGGIMIGAPIISRLFGKAVAEITRNNTERALGHGFKAGGNTLEADLAKLDSLAKQTRITNAAERYSARLGHYAEHQETYTNEIRAAEKARGKAVLSATENVGAAIYVGGSKVASGVCFGIVGFNHIYNQGAKNIEADRVTNDDLFASSVIAIPATAFAMLDTLRITVKGEINRHRLQAKGLLPRQIVAVRLKQLDDMEQRLKTAH